MQRVIRRLSLLSLTLLCWWSASGQVLDTFADGELSLNPTWNGSVSQWTVIPYGTGFALRSSGRAASDTLYLSTPSATAFGRWSFTFRYTDVNLSNFNGARIYLLSDTNDLTDAVYGYYLQFGANNTDQVGMYRQDGNAGNGRVLLARTDDAPLAASSGELSLIVERSPPGTWTVQINGSPALAAEDGTYAESHAFGFWVKHTAAAASAYLFDDLRIERIATEPAEPIRLGALVINEIYFDPPSSDLEFVEIFNRSDSTIDLRSLTMADETGRVVRLDDGPPLLQPGGYLVLAKSHAALTTAFPGISCVEVRDWPALNNDGDVVVLRSNEVTIDSVAYRTSWGGPDASLERRDPYGSSVNTFNWASSIHPSGATPGALNSTYERDTVPPSLVFAGQTGTLEIDVYFNEPVDSTSISPSTFHVGHAYPVALHQIEGTHWRLVFTSPPAHSGDATLTLTAVRDLAGNEARDLAAPVARLPALQDVVINEILYEPLADEYDGRPDQPEYVELINRTSYTLALDGLFLTGPPDEHGKADTLRFGRLLALQPHGYAVVFAQKDGVRNSAAESALALAFPATGLHDPSVALLSVSASSLSLNNSGDLVRLHGRDGTVLDEVRYEPDWHNPGLARTSGIALERLSPDLPSDASNWNSSPDPSGGTPGRQNQLYLQPAEPSVEQGLAVAPSPFSPDQDGHDDHAVFTYTLGAVGGTVRVRIYDARGRLVRTREHAGLAARSGRILWDGTDDAGHSLRIGIYIVVLEAVFPGLGKAEVYKEPVVLARRLD